MSSFSSLTNPEEFSHSVYCDLSEIVDKHDRMLKVRFGGWLKFDQSRKSSGQECESLACDAKAILTMADEMEARIRLACVDLSRKVSRRTVTVIPLDSTDTGIVTYAAPTCAADASHCVEAMGSLMPVRWRNGPVTGTIVTVLPDASLHVQSPCDDEANAYASYRVHPFSWHFQPRVDLHFR